MSIVLLSPAFERAKEIASQTSILEKLSQGLRIANDLSIGFKNEDLETSSNEVFIKLKCAVSPEIKEYLGFYGWKVDSTRRGMVFKLR